jgi:TRAP transporter TAXI family solute receptor
MIRLHATKHDEEMTYRRRAYSHAWWLFAVLALAALWGAWKFLQGATPRHVVLASGPADGMYHQYAQRYKQILARDGVVVEERVTGGAADNLQLLLDPKSKVDVGFVQGGVAAASDDQSIVMLASLDYEPLWIFYRSKDTLTQINALREKRIAVGTPGSGTAAFAAPLLEANGMTSNNTHQVAIGNIAALRALQSGDVDAALMIGAVQTPSIWQALYDPDIKVMSLNRADAYARRFPALERLTLPQGTIDLGQDIPSRDITLVGTKAMLVARADFPSALVNLLLDAAREVHSSQSFFEAAGEFPSTAPVDLPVSTIAESHKNYGPSFFHRYLPFWVATFVERLIILLVPLVVVLVPLFNFLPQVLRWRARSRIYRWYGQLGFLERDIFDAKASPAIAAWLDELDRIERSVSRMRIPASFASESYTLREHINMVRRAVLDMKAR